MQVQQSQLHMTSSHRLQAKHTEAEVKIESRRLDSAQAAQSESIVSARVSDSELTYSFASSTATAAEQSAGVGEVQMSSKESLKLAIIASISGDDGIDAPKYLPKNTTGDITGSLSFSANFSASVVTMADFRFGASAGAPDGEDQNGQQMLDVRVRTYEEHEFSSVNIRANLSMDDGRQFEISIDQKTERHYKESALDVLAREAVLTDPLVINFNGASASLNSERTEFDLDSDGKTESIATLGKNSAYIALDRNGDGQINNGSELFGTVSGNGFAELAEFDDDGNGFIDQGDKIYSQLSVYRPGDSFQTSFSDMGIVALSLDSVDSPFRLTDEQNQTLGQVRSTSFYVTEDGRANTVQQIDLAV